MFWNYITPRYIENFYFRACGGRNFVFFVREGGLKIIEKIFKKLHSAYIMQPPLIKPWEHPFSKKVDKWTALIQI